MSYARHAGHVVNALALSLTTVAAPAAATGQCFDWQPLPPLPDPIGVAGPFVGTHRGALIVAGGANFAAADAADLWDVPKKFQAAAYVLALRPGEAGRYAWQTGFSLGKPVAYGASASTPAGLVCAGGEDGTQALAEAFLLVWDPQAKALTTQPLPRLPAPSTAGGAAVIGNHVYMVAGQRGLGLDSATDAIWRLDLAKLGAEGLAWEPLPAVPGGPRAFAIVAAQPDGAAGCLYVIGGRRQKPGTTALAGIEPLADCHEFSPARFAVDPASGWRKRTDAPQPLMAGSAAAFGQSRLVVLAAADAESLAKLAVDPGFAKRHPGFPRQAWAYDTSTDTWTSAGATPACPVTTPAAAFAGGIALVSGETRPRIRTSAAWHVRERSRPVGEEQRDE